MYASDSQLLSQKMERNEKRTQLLFERVQDVYEMIRAHQSMIENASGQLLGKIEAFHR